MTQPHNASRLKITCKHLLLLFFLIACEHPSTQDSPRLSSPDMAADIPKDMLTESVDSSPDDLNMTDLWVEQDRDVEDLAFPDLELPDLDLRALCHDGLLNGQESDVDCGGGCAPCEDGEECLNFRDCISSVCAGGVCLPASCVDQLQNGDESDRDCGGSCSGCSAELSCRADRDCESGVCLNARCEASRCGDGVINGVEGCDDGNLNTEECDYGLSSCLVCAADCTEQAGMTHLCGDHFVDADEACDAGPSPSQQCVYGELECEVCNASCLWSTGQPRWCGDGRVHTLEGEECDDGNAITGDGCEPDCRVTPTFAFYQDQVQPLLVENCSSCHLGSRFGFASLQRRGDDFTEAETLANYENMLDLISLDAPTQSRLLAKIIPRDHPKSIEHAGGALVEIDDPIYTTLLQWIQLEKSEKCPDCGLTSTIQYLAYVDAPNLYWALDRTPSRGDHGLRAGQAKIMLQPINPETFSPEGEPIDFLGGRLCNEAGECDFGHLSVNHSGTQMVFECRLPVREGDDWLKDVNWNICIAEIGGDGQAINPRFLMPEERRHRQKTYARSSPFGLFNASGNPLKGVYDQHFRVRRSDDRTPIFSADDQRVILASRGADPRTGQRMTRTYHGFEFVDNIISVALDGSDPRTVYLNDGGTADSPFLLKDGNLAVHVWNLERMDRHLYIRTTLDGMMEQPPLFGRLQGPNMWGGATQLANGLIVGLTGRRRGAAELWLPFYADHTLGTGIEEGLTSFALLDPENDTHDPNFSYCVSPPDGQNCTVNRFYLDPAYSPDGRALFALNPELTYVAQGDAMYNVYSQGGTVVERLASLTPYLPQSLGIWLLDHKGERTPFIEPASGRMLRYPAWVGRRQPPRIKPTLTDESIDWAELHIAHVPLWLSFRYHNDGQVKRRLFERLNEITSLRVLVKIGDGNDCLNDGRPYRNAVHDTYDHPTHLGINNSTGYDRLVIPPEAGGDEWGDVPLQADGSIRLRLPAGELLLFQGINAEGRVISQHTRVFAMPPGHQVNTGVRREQYYSQCSSCHGVVGDEPFIGLQQTELLGTDAMDFDTDASLAEIVDLTSTVSSRQTMTFREQVRPLLDTHCTSCHAGALPAGELSLASEYSTTANYPAGSRANQFSEAFLAFVPAEARVPGYDFSVPYSWFMRDDQNEYRNHSVYAPLIEAHVPLSELAPWDPAYQNLMLFSSGGYRYLGGDGYASHYGRADVLGGNSQNAWLIEILTGADLDTRFNFSGPDHTSYLSETELRTLRAVMDLGFPYTARCDDSLVPSGPNEGLPWGDPEAISY